MPIQRQIKVSAEIPKLYANKFIGVVKSIGRSDVILLNVSECFDNVYVEILAPLDVINELNEYIDFYDNEYKKGGELI